MVKPMYDLDQQTSILGVQALDPESSIFLVSLANILPSI